MNLLKLHILLSENVDTSSPFPPFPEVDSQLSNETDFESNSTLGPDIAAGHTPAPVTVSTLPPIR